MCLNAENVKEGFNNRGGLPWQLSWLRICNNAGDTGSITGLARSPGEGIGYPLQYSWASLVAQLVKESACSVGDLSLIPGLGRSPGKGNSYPLWYSGLENWMECTVHGVTESDTTEWISLSTIEEYLFSLRINIQIDDRLWWWIDILIDRMNSKNEWRGFLRKV